MTYALQPAESVATGVARIVREQVNKARGSIRAIPQGQPVADLDEAAHEVRKRAKKVRAAFRLVRPALPKGVYSRENAWYRDLARELAGTRDAQAVVECVTALAKTVDDEDDRAKVESVKASLEARREALRDSDLMKTLTDVDERLSTGLDRLDDLELEQAGFDAVAGGLAKTYARNLDRAPEAFATGQAEAFHEWRKRAKYHRYHCDLLEALWPDAMSARESTLHDLTDLLGDAHDLFELGRILESEPEPFDEAARRKTLDIANTRRAELRRRARPLAGRLFAESTSTFVDRLEHYWRAWRIETEGGVRKAA